MLDFHSVTLELTYSATYSSVPMAAPKIIGSAFCGDVDS